MSDVELENKIECARLAMTNAVTLEDRREHYEEMRWLISQRSGEQIARMEARLPEPWRS